MPPLGCAGRTCHVVALCAHRLAAKREPIEFSRRFIPLYDEYVPVLGEQIAEVMAIRRGAALGSNAAASGASRKHFLSQSHDPPY